MTNKYAHRANTAIGDAQQVLESQMRHNSKIKEAM